MSEPKGSRISTIHAANLSRLFQLLRIVILLLFFNFGIGVILLLDPLFPLENLCELLSLGDLPALRVLVLLQLGARVGMLCQLTVGPMDWRLIHLPVRLRAQLGSGQRYQFIALLFSGQNERVVGARRVQVRPRSSETLLKLRLVRLALFFYIANHLIQMLAVHLFPRRVEQVGLLFADWPRAQILHGCRLLSPARCLILTGKIPVSLGLLLTVLSEG